MTVDDEAGQVGIFWGVPDGGAVQLVTEATALVDAETYGDFLTHRHGHVETWDAWRALGSTALVRRGLPAAIASHEYEDFPRGRIVFHVPDRQFTVYADRRLHAATLWQRILSVFALPAARTRLLGDAHYRTGASPDFPRGDAP